MNTYQYDLVEKMSFVRWGGTDKELEAANILMDEIKKFGGEGRIEEFDEVIEIVARLNDYLIKGFYT